MSTDKYCLDSQTIAYYGKRRFPYLSLWITENKPYITDISEEEAIQSFKYHISKREKLSASLEEIKSKKQELEYLEKFFRKAKQEGRYIDTSKDPEIQQRAKELNENGITPSVGERDCRIAVGAENHGLILITSDKDLKDKLTNENNLNNGQFKFAYYPFIYLEQTFQQWLQA